MVLVQPEPEDHGGKKQGEEEAMTPDEKKEAALSLLRAADATDVAAAEALISEDFQFQFMERADSWSVDGLEVPSRLNRDMFLKYGITAAQNITRDGMHFTIDLVLCDGDYVCIFGESHAESNQGRAYNNTYCWRFRFSGDRICEFLEYCDTHHAHMVLFEQ